MKQQNSRLEFNRPVPWVWSLGDGLKGGANCFAPCPPGRLFRGDPAASLALGEMMPEGVVRPEHFKSDARRDRYLRLREIVGTEAIFRRIPANRFSAVDFVERLVKGHVELDIARSVALGFGHRLPLPIFFTHRRVPVFRDDEQRDDALTFLEELLSVRGSLEATWTRPGWGLSPDDDGGGDHYMVGVLRIVERLDWDWPAVSDREPWQRVRRFFKSVSFAEQVVGASWVCLVAPSAQEV